MLYVYLLIAIAGAVASWISYTTAAVGGHYYIFWGFWGAVVFGLYRFLLEFPDVSISRSPMGECQCCRQTKPLFQAGWTAR